MNSPCFLSFRRVVKESVFFLLLCAIPSHAQNLPAGTRPPDSVREETPLMKAEDVLAAGDAAKAMVLLLPLTAQPGPDAVANGRAWYDLGIANEALRNGAAAEAAYRSAIAADPKQFEAHAALGRVLINKDRAASITELETAAALSPAANPVAAKAEVLRTLASLHADHEPAKARDELLEAIRLTGETREDTRMTAWIAARMGDTKDAEAIYRRMLQAVPNDPEIVYSLSAILIAQEKLGEAESMLQAALEAHPEYTPNNAQLARVYMQSGQQEKAVPLLEREHAKYPKDAAVTRMLADVCNRTGDAPRADALYQVLLADSPNDIGLLSARGDALIRQKRFAEAQTSLQHADVLFLARPSAFPATDDRVQLTSSLAFAASENGQPAAVLAALDQRLEYADETPATLFLRATAHDHLHHVAQARSFYTQFIAAAQGKFPDEEWEAKHRLIALAHEK